MISKTVNQDNKISLITAGLTLSLFILLYLLGTVPYVGIPFGLLILIIAYKTHRKTIFYLALIITIIVGFAGLANKTIRKTSVSKSNSSHSYLKITRA